MTAKQIRAKMVRLYAKELMVKEEIAEMRANCPHENSTGQYYGNGGNWCPQDDEYWLRTECLDCGRVALVDSEDDEYRHFTGKIIRD